MESTPSAVTAFEAALPPDPRVVRKQMFGVPCAFVNRQMFFGTFEGDLVARIGPVRAEIAAAEPGRQVFTPRENQPWKDYVRLQANEAPEVLSALAAEALAWTAKLPLKAHKPRARSR